jgi:hypothetical protein
MDNQKLFLEYFASQHPIRGEEDWNNVRGIDVNKIIAHFFKSM